jgi:hypothetical protein
MVADNAAAAQLLGRTPSASPEIPVEYALNHLPKNSMECSGQQPDENNGL